MGRAAKLMKLAIILDPLEHIKTYKDSTYAMMREATRRGHSVHVLEQQDLALRGNRVVGFASELTLVEDEAAWYHAGEPQATPLQDFDVVLMRKDPPFDMEYIYSTYLLELAEGQGARIFNRPSAIRDYNEKLAVGKFPEFTPPTLVTRRADLLRLFVGEHDDAILKPLDGMGGAGVFRTQISDPNLNVIIETLTQEGQRTIMAQRYIPEIVKGDKRVLIIDGEPVPYSLARVPGTGDARGNLARGATGIAQPLTARDREIARALGPKLKAQGLILVGLDIIGDYLTEINVTSPTCMQEIQQQTGFNAAAMMIEALERRV
jgi:glutathione synthase